MAPALHPTYCTFSGNYLTFFSLSGSCSEKPVTVCLNLLSSGILDYGLDTTEIVCS